MNVVDMMDRVALLSAPVSKRTNHAASSKPQLLRSTSKSGRFASAAAAPSSSSTYSSAAVLRPSVALPSRHFSAESETVVSKKRVEDVMPIAMCGKKILDIDFPEGPFGTKENDYIIISTTEFSKQ
nr:putative cytochrome C oxidase subunit 5B-like [Ipomoea batatas]